MGFSVYRFQKRIFIYKRNSHNVWEFELNESLVNTEIFKNVVALDSLKKIKTNTYFHLIKKTKYFFFTNNNAIGILKRFRYVNH